MAITVRELVTFWGFETDLKPLERMDAGIKNAKESLLALSTATVAAAGTIFGIAKFTANAGDEAFKMSQKIGIGVEALQELGYAAKLADVDTHQFQQGMQLLSRQTVAASQGSAEAQKAFRQLGISIRDQNGKLKGADRLFLDISDRFQKLPDGVQKTALAMDLFGRSGADMIPLLNSGSAEIAKLRKEARDLGVVLDADAAKASEEFNDSLTRLMAAFTGIRNIVGVELLPVIQELVLEIKDFIVENRELVSGSVREAVVILTEAMRSMLSIMKQVAKTAISLTKAFGGVARVARILSQVLIGILGLKVAFGFGQIIQGLYGLVVAFRAAGISALIAQAQILLIPLAIAALVVALGLIIEDIVAFFQGRDSVLGRAIEALKGPMAAVVDYVVEVFTRLKDTAVGAFQAIVDFGMQVGQVLYKWIVEPIQLVIETLAKIPNLVQGGLGGLLGQASGFLGGLFGNAAPATEALMGMPANVGSSPQTASTAISNQKVTQNATLKVDVTGLPDDVAKQVAKESMTDALDALLRDTGRAAQPAIER